jgi:hypothetical protein
MTLPALFQLYRPTLLQLHRPTLLQLPMEKPLTVATKK